LPKDRLLELLQRWSRLDPQLLDQRCARIPVCLERVHLPSRPVERKHQMATQPLTEGMRPDQLLNLRDELAMSPERKVGLDALLERGQPQLLQRGDRSLGEWLVREICEGRPSPQAQGVGQHRRPHGEGGIARLIEQPLETIRIHRVRRDRKEIAGRDRTQDRGVLTLVPAGLEHLPEPRHVPLDDRARGRRSVLAPELVDQPLGRDGLACVQHQEREQRAPPPRRQGQGSGPIEDLHPSQDLELHRRLPQRGIDRSTRQT
jgi:hypothetical protein